MGQYYKIVNITKKQLLHPHTFGDGLKLLEFGASGNGTMTGLAILLANSNNRGGGDLHSDNPIIGSWAGDNICIVGDYSELFDRGVTYEQIEDYTDISIEVIRAMCDDDYLKSELVKRGATLSSVKVEA